MTTYDPHTFRAHPCRPTLRARLRRLAVWLDENSYDVVIVATLLFVVALVGGK